MHTCGCNCCHNRHPRDAPHAGHPSHVQQLQRRTNGYEEVPTANADKTSRARAGDRARANHLSDVRQSKGDHVLRWSCGNNRVVAGAIAGHSLSAPYGLSYEIQNAGASCLCLAARGSLLHVVVALVCGSESQQFSVSTFSLAMVTYMLPLLSDGFDTTKDVIFAGLCIDGDPERDKTLAGGGHSEPSVAIGHAHLADLARRRWWRGVHLRSAWQLRVSAVREQQADRRGHLQP
eukprot:923868-Amphidinium_carterae.1